MLEHKGVLISSDVLEEQFVCDLNKCKGACCIEGDLGAPLEKHELQTLDDIYDKVEPYLMEDGKKAIQEQGKYIKDWEDDFSTPTIEGRECAYVFYDFNGHLKCGIEQAFLDGKIDYRKPMSCYMYPIRIMKLKGYEALNYDRWDICSDACSLGKELKTTVFDFLKAPLSAKYGKEWVEEVSEIIPEYLKHNRS